MGIELTTERFYPSVRLDRFYELLSLARQFDWQSEGAAGINEYEWDAEQHRIGFVAACEKYLAEGRARRNYYGGDYWCIVSASDAKGLAQALRRVVAAEEPDAATHEFDSALLQALIELFDDGPVVLG